LPTPDFRVVTKICLTAEMSATEFRDDTKLRRGVCVQKHLKSTFWALGAKMKALEVSFKAQV